jgi:hypothetical protein
MVDAVGGGGSATSSYAAMSVFLAGFFLAGCVCGDASVSHGECVSGNFTLSPFEPGM